MTTALSLLLAAACGFALTACHSTDNNATRPLPPLPPVAPHPSAPPARAAQPQPPTPPTPPLLPIRPASATPPIALKELFPGIRADLSAKVVEFDAITSPMLMDDPKAPLFFVETLVCSPDTREHESLLVTDVKPSHLHAAMLAIGLVPGAPGLFKFENGQFQPVDATGDRVTVEVHSAQGSASDPRTWLINVADRDNPEPRRFGSDAEDASGGGHGWVFAGSSMRTVADKAGAMQEVYDADGTGIVVGLCCFGSEVIAWSRTFSHDASIDAPEWIADFSRTPPPGTKVRIRLRPVGR